MTIAALTALPVILLKGCGESCHRENVSEKPCIKAGMKDYNLVIINIDALRAGHLGCYGYERDTSPFIDSLADEGLVFKRALSNSSFTRESVAVLLSGRLPSSGGSVGWDAAPSSQVKNMGTLFKEAGYHTAFLSNSGVLKDARFHAGFDEVWHNDDWGVSGQGPALSKRAGAFMRRWGGEKFMIYLHYLDPHGPYEPPPVYYLRFSESVYPHPLPLYKQIRKECASLIEQGFGPGEDRFEDLVLRYDGEIAFVDRAIASLFQTLRRLNLDQETLVLITADHGEEFLEHQYVEHAWTLYQESLHIPLILWAPGVMMPRRIDGLVSTVDMLPTLVRLLDIPHDRDDFDGSCLFSAKEGGYYFSPPAKPFMAELLIQHRSLVRAVIQGQWKYIAAQKWLSPRRRPEALQRMQEDPSDQDNPIDIWGPVVHEALYDLSADPGEKQSLSEDEKLGELRALLKQYEDYCRRYGLKKSGRGKIKASPSMKDVEKLKALGYI